MINRCVRDDLCMSTGGELVRIIDTEYGAETETLSPEGIIKFKGRFSVPMLSGLKKPEGDGWEEIICTDADLRGYYRVIKQGAA